MHKFEWENYLNNVWKSSRFTALWFFFLCLNGKHKPQNKVPQIIPPPHYNILFLFLPAWLTMFVTYFTLNDLDTFRFSGHEPKFQISWHWLAANSRTANFRNPTQDFSTNENVRSDKTGRTDHASDDKNGILGTAVNVIVITTDWLSTVRLIGVISSNNVPTVVRCCEKSPTRPVQRRMFDVLRKKMMKGRKLFSAASVL